MDVVSAVGDALAMAGSMGWQILWPLVLGFTLSDVIQAVVRKARVTQLMADDSPRSIAVSALFGAASSSCSYAAVALARALFRKGADRRGGAAAGRAGARRVDGGPRRHGHVRPGRRRVLGPAALPRDGVTAVSRYFVMD